MACIFCDKPCVFSANARGMKKVPHHFADVGLDLYGLRTNFKYLPPPTLCQGQHSNRQGYDRPQ